MGRKARCLQHGNWYYIETRSCRLQKIFFMDCDYAEYLKRLRKYKLRFGVRVYAYCLMSNTVYLVIYPCHAQKLPLFMQCLKQSYALYFNRRYNGLGKVWGERYKSVGIQYERDLFESVKSVEFIPVREGCARSPFEYPYSSCRYRILGLGGVINCLPQNEVRLSEILIHKDFCERRKDENEKFNINGCDIAVRRCSSESIGHLK